MAKKIIVAKLTHEGKEYVGKRDTKMYDETTKVTLAVVGHANQGLTLDVQRSIREALKVKYGIKTVTSGGVSKDLSSVESV